MASLSSMNCLIFTAVALSSIECTTAWYGEGDSSENNINRDIDQCVVVYADQSGVKSDGSGIRVVPGTYDWCGALCQDDIDCVGFDLDSTNIPFCMLHTAGNFNQNEECEDCEQYTKVNGCTAVCHSSWDIIVDSAAYNGGGGIGVPTCTASAGNLTGCLDYCLRGVPDCVGVEYSPFTSPPCYYFTYSAQDGMLNVVSDSLVTQYRLSQRCAETCVVTWPIQPSTRYTDLENPYYTSKATNVDECFDQCVLDPKCAIYIVTSPSSDQPFQCQLAWNYDFNSYVKDPDVDSYLFEEACPKEV